MFAVTMGKGFRMTFANGWRVSVQWGCGNYCHSQDYSARYGAEMTHEFWTSETAEVAAWDANDKWYSFGADTVKGWMTANEVLAFLVEVAAFPLSTKNAE